MGNDDNVHNFEVEVTAANGKNVLQINGEGDSDKVGMTIDNVELVDAPASSATPATTLPPATPGTVSLAAGFTLTPTTDNSQPAAAPKLTTDNSQPAAMTLVAAAPKATTDNSQPASDHLTSSPAPSTSAPKSSPTLFDLTKNGIPVSKQVPVNLIKNGNFSDPLNGKPSTLIKDYDNGWTAPEVEILSGPVANKNWPSTAQVAHLDTGVNQNLIQTLPGLTDKIYRLTFD